MVVSSRSKSGGTAAAKSSVDTVKKPSKETSGTRKASSGSKSKVSAASGVKGKGSGKSEPAAKGRGRKAASSEAADASPTAAMSTVETAGKSSAPDSPVVNKKPAKGGVTTEKLDLTLSKSELDAAKKVVATKKAAQLQQGGAKRRRVEDPPISADEEVDDDAPREAAAEKKQAVKVSAAKAGQKQPKKSGPAKRGVSDDGNPKVAAGRNEPTEDDDEPNRDSRHVEVHVESSSSSRSEVSEWSSDDEEERKKTTAGVEDNTETTERELLAAEEFGSEVDENRDQMEDTASDHEPDHHETSAEDLASKSLAVDDAGTADSPQAPDTNLINPLDVEIQLHNGGDKQQTLRQWMKKWKADYVSFIVYTKASTPGCTKQCVAVSKLADVPRTVKAVGLSLDDEAKQSAFATKHGLKFPLVCGGNHEMLEALQCLSPEGKILRSMIVVDDKGTMIYEKHRVKAEPSVADLAEWLAANIPTRSSSSGEDKADNLASNVPKGPQPQRKRRAKENIVEDEITKEEDEGSGSGTGAQADDEASAEGAEDEVPGKPKRETGKKPSPSAAAPAAPSRRAKTTAKNTSETADESKKTKSTSATAKASAAKGGKKGSKATETTTAKKAGKKSSA